VKGYSDRINHALAFAAKHLERQVHKGARAPYGTAPANIAIILARFGQDDDTIVTGILRDVVHDCVRERDRSMLQERIRAKFGDAVFDHAASAVPHATDDSGLELSHEEAREDLLDRLGAAPDPVRWVVAADVLHDVSSALAELARTIDPDSVWSRLPLGRDGTTRWYRRVHDRLHDVGFQAPIMSELRDAIEEVERRALLP
jgi:(p)ppGpp synthase/HD superfamily hydrolase